MPKTLFERATEAQRLDATDNDAEKIAATLIICGGEPECDHDFQGWREFDDGCGGETVCTKCGIGAMEWSMRYLP